MKKVMIGMLIVLFSTSVFAAGKMKITYNWRTNAEHQARAVASRPECGCSQSNSTKGVR